MMELQFDLEMGMRMDMDLEMEMDINRNHQNEQQSAELSTPYYLCAFGNTDSNGSAGAESEDSLNGHSRRSTTTGAAPRQKINARERYRTFNVNAAYEALRGLIPTEPVNRKLSKIEIIRLASSYITHLRSTLQAGTDRQPCLVHKWEQKCGEEEKRSGVVERVSICTFCLKPNLAQSGV